MFISTKKLFFIFFIAIWPYTIKSNHLNMVIFPIGRDGYCEQTLTNRLGGTTQVLGQAIVQGVPIYTGKQYLLNLKKFAKNNPVKTVICELGIAEKFFSFLSNEIEKQQNCNVELSFLAILNETAAIRSEKICLETYNALYNLYTEALDLIPHTKKESIQTALETYTDLCLELLKDINNLCSLSDVTLYHQQSAYNALCALNKYDLFESPNGEYVLCLPRFLTKTYSLSSLGINPEFRPIEAIENLESCAYSRSQANLQELKAVFLPGQSIDKRIVLVGHGTSNIYNNLYPQHNLSNNSSQTAELSYSQYHNYLELLESINTSVLMIRSCYAGGSNFIDMQKTIKQQNNKELFENPPITFPIIIEGSLDSTIQSTETSNFKQFFAEIDAFLKKRNLASIKFANHLIIDSFKEIVGAIVGDELKTMPSVRIPGKHTPFIPLALSNQTAIINYPALLSHELCHREQGKTVPLPIHCKKNLLLHPSRITIPIKITGEVPVCMSMIPGDGYHVIDLIHMPTLPFYKLAKKALWIEDLAAKKGLFIKKIIAKNNSDSGILHPENTSLDTEHQTLCLENVFIAKEPLINPVKHTLICLQTIIMRVPGDSSQKPYREALNNKSFQSLSQEDAYKKIKASIERFNVRHEGLKEATHGIECINTAKSIVIKHIASKD